MSRWSRSLVLVCLFGCGGSDDPADPAFAPTDASAAADVAASPDPGTLDAAGADAASSDAFVAPTIDASADGGAPPDAGPAADDAAVGPSPFVAGPFAVERSEVPLGSATAINFVPVLPAATRVPLVLLKHGFQLTTASYTELATRIASHGFVVVGVDTPSALFGGPTNADERDATVAALDWALGAAPFAAQLDASRVAIVGHSRGGKVATMVAAADPRIGATLLLDPVNACGPGAPYDASCPDVTSAAIAGSIATPIGVMGETANAEGFMPCAPRDQNYRTIYAALARSSWAVAWTFDGADHMDFTDDGGGFAGLLCPDGPADDAAVRESVRALAVAFLRRHLSGDLSMDDVLVGASLPSGVTSEGP